MNSLQCVLITRRKQLHWSARTASWMLVVGVLALFAATTAQAAPAAPKGLPAEQAADEAERKKTERPPMAGNLAYAAFTGPVTGKEVRHALYLPPGYSDSASRGQRYPVLYQLHWRYGSEKSHAEAYSRHIDSAIQAGTLPPLIVAYPNGYKLSMWGDDPEGKFPAETQLVRELIPHIDSVYRTRADRRYRIVQGMSMGGYGAALHAFKHADLFGLGLSYDGAILDWQGLMAGDAKMGKAGFGGDSVYALAFSPWEQATRYAQRPAAQRPPLRFKQVVGSILDRNRAFRDHLKALGLKTDYLETGCDHHFSCMLAHEAGDDFKYLTRYLQEANAQ